MMTTKISRPSSEIFLSLQPASLQWSIYISLYPYLYSTYVHHVECTFHFFLKHYFTSYFLLHLWYRVSNDTEDVKFNEFLSKLYFLHFLLYNVILEIQVPTFYECATLIKRILIVWIIYDLHTFTCQTYLGPIRLPFLVT